jgi:predicted RNase H-like HicB family nuclease
MGMAFLNTHKSGSVRSIIFSEKKEWFGVALEFNIVETGDSPEEVMMLLDEAVKGYVESAQKGKLSIGVLNQNTDPEYERLWQSQSMPQKKTGKQIYRLSSQPLSALVS